MPDKPAITSSELGILWLTYQEKTMTLRMLEYFIEKADDDKAQEIMKNAYKEMDHHTTKIIELFHREGAVLPVGFTSQDVNKEAPKLYDNGFDIMFMRLLSQISMGLHSLNITMAYREDVILLLKELTASSQNYYNLCTQYLLEKGLIVRSPYVTMPQSAEFVKDKTYLGGTTINPFSDKRTLNTVEVAHLFHSIESNITGIQMIIGFAQCAVNKEAKNYFNEGAELSKNIINKLSETLLESGLQSPATSGGNPTRSTVSPFSDKLMMYCTSIFCSFGIGGNSIGTSFSLRSDLSASMSIFMKDIFEYAHKGAKIMIKNRWMEEPPQMEERGEIIKE